MTVAQIQTDVRAQNAHRFSIREYTRVLSSSLSLYLSTCVCVWLEGKNPLQSVVDDSADYVGEKKGERIRILLETKSPLPFFCPFFFFFFSATRPLSVIKRKGEGPKMLHRDPSKRSRTASKAFSSLNLSSPPRVFCSPYSGRSSPRGNLPFQYPDARNLPSLLYDARLRSILEKHRSRIKL